MNIRTLVSFVCLTTALALGTGVQLVRGADSAFVGVLSLAVDESVAKDLELSDEVRTQLQKIVNEREDAALELAIELKGLASAERAAKLAPFVAESEKLGLALLTEAQRTKLMQLRISRAGMAGLAETQIATDVGLTDEQKAEVAKVMEDLQAALAKGGEREQQTAKAYYERKLAGILTIDQRTKWEQLTGRVVAEVAAAETTPEPGTTKPATDDTTPKASTGKTPATGAEETGKADPKEATVDRPPGETKLKFQFKYAPWKDVLEWFAEHADLSLDSVEMPAGTFNYSDKRVYTPEQAIDLLNSALLTRGYTLIRRERMLIVYNLENGPPPGILVPQVPLEDLDKKGEYELISCLFQLVKWIPEEAEAEVRKLIGPQGSVVVLPKAKQLNVTETAGRMRAIRKVIDAVENPVTPKNERVQVIKLVNLGPSEFMVSARQLMAMPENVNSTPDGSLRLAIDEFGSRILATGKADQIDKLLEIVKLLDVAPDPSDDGPGLVEDLQLQVYALGSLDPVTVLQVMQTLLAGTQDLKLAIDPKTSTLIAHARPTQHSTIKATLDEMQKDGMQVEVIRLRKADPQTVMISIGKLFGGADAASLANAPKVDADPVNGQIIIRGTKGQIAQIQAMLEKMGEVGDAADAFTAAERTTTRMITSTPRSARNALDQLQAVWNTAHPNKLTIKTIPSMQEDGTRPRERTTTPRLDLNSIPGFGPLPGNSRPATGRPAAPVNPGEQPVDPDATEPSEENPNQPAVKTPPEKAPPPTLPDAEPDLPTKPVPEAAPAKEEPKEAPKAEPQVKPDLSGVRLEKAQYVAFGQDTPAAAPAEAEKPQPKAADAEKPAAATENLADKFDAGIITYVEDLLKEQDKNSDGFIDSEEWKAGKWSTPPETSDSNKDGKLSKEELCVRVAERLAREAAANPTGAPEPIKSVPGAEVVITIGPSGIIVTSEDLDALDEVEAFLRSIVEESAGGKEFTVYYLKFAKAEIAGSLLQEVLGGGSGESAGGGGGSLMGDIAGGLLGNMGGGLLGNLMGGGGSSSGATASGNVKIISDPRLNALFVEASSKDLDTIEQLLKVIDQESGPEDVQTSATPKFIPVFNQPAEDVAAIVRQVYSGRLSSDGGGNRQQPPSPQDFIMAMRGGGRNNNQAKKGEEQKMTIGVDNRSNSLIVSAPEYLFNEVKALVNHLDTATVPSDETVTIVKLNNSNPDLISRSLTKMVGPAITTGRTAATTTRPAGTAGMTAAGGTNPGGFNQPTDQVRQQVDMFNLMQGMRGGGGGGFPGGGGGGGFPGGGGGGGRRGGGGGGFPGGGGGFPGGGGGFPGGGGGGFPGGGGIPRP